MPNYTLKCIYPQHHFSKKKKTHDDCIDLIHSTISCDFSGKVGDNCHEATINFDMDDSVVFGCPLMFCLRHDRIMLSSAV